MKDLLMMRGAATLLDGCAVVKPEESVLIVTDMLKYEIAEFWPQHRSKEAPKRF